jgi:hypothetical protein
MKNLLAAVALTMACLLGLSMNARAEDADRVVVNVPFAFVAGSQTLPAGTYSIGRVSDDSHSGIVIQNYKKSVLVLPSLVAGAPVQQLTVSFERVGEQYFLSKVETPAGAYIMGTPRAVTMAAKARDHGAVSSSGTN